MASEPTAMRPAPLFVDPPGYARYRPEETLLYQLVGPIVRHENRVHSSVTAAKQQQLIDRMIT